MFAVGSVELTPEADGLVGCQRTCVVAMVEDEPEFEAGVRSNRLALSQLIARPLGYGLGLLGITALERL